MGALWLICPFVSAGSQSSPEPILKRMAEAYRSLQTLRADLTQVKSYPQLGLTDPPEEGRLFIKRKKNDMRVRLEIGEPESRIVTVDNDKYMLYQPKIQQVIEGAVQPGKSGGASFVRYFLGDLSQAQQDYDIVSEGEEELEGHHTAHLRLTAKPGGQAFYPRIDLWVDTTLWIPIRQLLIEPNQSEIRLSFDDIRINGPVEDNVFKIDLPPGVERIKG